MGDAIGFFILPAVVVAALGIVLYREFARVFSAYKNTGNSRNLLWLGTLAVYCLAIAAYTIRTSINIVDIPMGLLVYFFKLPFIPLGFVTPYLGSIIGTEWTISATIFLVCIELVSIIYVVRYLRRL
ncbi:MAG: hypothetical protein KBD06_00900 [Candidatus Pacebacteria bacterium]|nr:hypothetical protein [Candidatus Paceibacterota bacterium]